MAGQTKNGGTMGHYTTGRPIPTHFASEEPVSGGGENVMNGTGHDIR
jgi:hypothetical protein